VVQVLPDKGVVALRAKHQDRVQQTVAQIVSGSAVFSQQAHCSPAEQPQLQTLLGNIAIHVGANWDQCSQLHGLWQLLQQGTTAASVQVTTHLHNLPDQLRSSHLDGLRCNN
jgi:hypothetical protein